MIGPDRALEGIDTGLGDRAWTDRPVSAPRVPVRGRSRRARRPRRSNSARCSRRRRRRSANAPTSARAATSGGQSSSTTCCSRPASTCRAARTRTAWTISSVAIRDQPTLQDCRCASAPARGSAAPRSCMADVGRDCRDRRRRGRHAHRFRTARSPAACRRACCATATAHQRTVGLTCASCSSLTGCRTRPIAAIGLRAYHMLQGLRDRAEVELVSLVHDDEEASHVEEVERVRVQRHAAARADAPQPRAGCRARWRPTRR